MNKGDCQGGGPSTTIERGPVNGSGAEFEHAQPAGLRPQIVDGEQHLEARLDNLSAWVLRGLGRANLQTALRGYPPPVQHSRLGGAQLQATLEIELSLATQ